MSPGIRRPAGHPLPGDLGQERHQRRAGVHDDGGRDQEPRGTPGAIWRRRTGQDRVHPSPGEQGRRMLLEINRFGEEDSNRAQPPLFSPNRTSVV